MEGLWTKGLLIPWKVATSKIGVPQELTGRVVGDNATIYLDFIEVLRTDPKHLEGDFERTRDEIRNGTLGIRFLREKAFPSVIFEKNLSKVKEDLVGVFRDREYAKLPPRNLGGDRFYETVLHAQNYLVDLDIGMIDATSDQTGYLIAVTSEIKRTRAVTSEIKRTRKTFDAMERCLQGLETYSFNKSEELVDGGISSTVRFSLPTRLNAGELGPVLFRVGDGLVKCLLNRIILRILFRSLYKALLFINNNGSG